MNWLDPVIVLVVAWFAVMAYRTAFLARHFPAEYYAALLSH